MINDLLQLISYVVVFGLGIYIGINGV